MLKSSWYYYWTFGVIWVYNFFLSFIFFLFSWSFSFPWIVQKCWGLTWSKVGQSDFCSQEEFVLQSLPQLLPLLRVSHGGRSWGCPEQCLILKRVMSSPYTSKAANHPSQFHQAKSPLSSRQSSGEGSECRHPALQILLLIFTAPTHRCS